MPPHGTAGGRGPPMPQRFQQAREAASAAAVLWRARSLAIQAPGKAHQVRRRGSPAALTVGVHSFRKPFKKAIGGQTMLCPECEKAGLTSRVKPSWFRTTTMLCLPYHDEQGQEHLHDGNWTSPSYRCSRGHVWEGRSFRRSCWCGWPGDPEERRAEQQAQEVFGWRRSVN